jgi:hypothetical protein
VTSATGPAVLTREQQTVLASSIPLAHRWDAYLAGGMALALHLGHRRSADFDWFTPKTLAPAEVLKDLRSLAIPLHVRQNDDGTFLGQVGGVDYSVFRYPYPLVEPPVRIAGAAVASLTDIAAMKMTAIAQRATKRDYVDLHAIFHSHRLGLRDVVFAMQQKYPRYDPAHSLRALTYFRDVDPQPMPVMLTPTSWDEIKRDLLRIRDRHRGPSR